MFHRGSLLTGSPQDLHALACQPHSLNCLPALTHPGDSTCLLVNPKHFLCVTCFPTVGRLSFCLRKADIYSATLCCKPLEITHYWGGGAGCHETRE
uniref:Uncharacterized protein n=1 Tax=Microcebus murinus TaxID=30608 RepID=A0A8C5YHD3_MICMU